MDQRSSVHPGRWLRNYRLRWRSASAAAVLAFCAVQPRSDEPVVEVIPLPPLQIRGQPANAHTQGLELVDRNYLVTARQENVQPKRALLLRISNKRSAWDIWDITPTNQSDEATILDHPGGMQSDGERLWVPIAESRRHGRSRIRAFPLGSLVVDRPLAPSFEFEVPDHIGAIAVSRKDGLLFGASWDTERVYVWNLQGQLKRILTNDELTARELGVRSDGLTGGGIAVQDWKVVGENLYASGLFHSAGLAAISPASRLSRFEHFLDRDFQCRTVRLPQLKGIGLANEAMSVSDGMVYFLPEDLGATNRLFRVPYIEFGELKAGKSPK